MQRKYSEPGYASPDSNTRYKLEIRSPPLARDERMGSASRNCDVVCPDQRRTRETLEVKLANTSPAREDRKERQPEMAHCSCRAFQVEHLQDAHIWKGCGSCTCLDLYLCCFRGRPRAWNLKFESTGLSSCLRSYLGRILNIYMVDDLQDNEDHHTMVVWVPWLTLSSEPEQPRACWARKPSSHRGIPSHLYERGELVRLVISHG